jgi:hypothetical protein
MRSLTALGLLILGSPLAAQTPAPVQPQQDIQRALNDPAMTDRLANAMEAVSDAFMKIPVGEVQAAVEGRTPTPQEKKLTVGDIARRDHVDVRRQIAETRPMIQHSMKAMADALPVLMKSLSDASEALDRAAANMPDPTYPKR